MANSKGSEKSQKSCFFIGPIGDAGTDIRRHSDFLFDGIIREVTEKEGLNYRTKIALELDAGLRGGDYAPTEAELAGIDRGLRDAEQGRYATEHQVEDAFAKFRGK